MLEMPSACCLSLSLSRFACSDKYPLVIPSGGHDTKGSPLLCSAVFSGLALSARMGGALPAHHGLRILASDVHPPGSKRLVCKPRSPIIPWRAASTRHVLSEAWLVRARPARATDYYLVRGSEPYQGGRRSIAVRDEQEALTAAFQVIQRKGEVGNDKPLWAQVSLAPTSTKTAPLGHARMPEQDKPP